MDTALTGATRRIRLAQLKKNRTAVTSLGGGESVTWQMTTSSTRNAGTVLDSGSGTYDSAAGYWYADVTMPSTAQTVYIHWTVVKGGATDYFSSAIQVGT